MRGFPQIQRRALPQKIPPKQRLRLFDAVVGSLALSGIMRQLDHASGRRNDIAVCAVGYASSSVGKTLEFKSAKREEAGRLFLFSLRFGTRY